MDQQPDNQFAKAAYKLFWPVSVAVTVGQWASLTAEPCPTRRCKRLPRAVTVRASSGVVGKTRVKRLIIRCKHCGKLLNWLAVPDANQSETANQIKKGD